MERNYITNGTKVNTLQGYLDIKDFNGSIVYCDEYETFKDEELIGERRLTLDEIAHIMKEVDGRNHIVEWQPRIWYAVQHDSSDPWDGPGAETLEEAIDLANYEEADIIVKIDQLDSFALAEYHRGEDF